MILLFPENTSYLHDNRIISTQKKRWSDFTIKFPILFGLQFLWARYYLYNLGGAMVGDVARHSRQKVHITGYERDRMDDYKRDRARF